MMIEQSKKQIIIDYVASGFAASFRLGSPHKDFEKAKTVELKKSTLFLQSLLKDKKHILLSGLFNAFTEDIPAKRVTEVGEDFNAIFPGGMYVDSGGLQVITQGKKIDADMRKKIYEIQGTHGDFAMSFDNIPDKVIDGKRYYSPDMVHDAGLGAGDNLKEQIRAFKEMGTKTKIMPIIQGLGAHDMNLYATNMFSKLNKTETKFITSLSFGGGGSGYEMMDRIMNGAKSELIQDKLSHVHILGVTGFQRLLPSLMVAQNELLPGVKRLSFDSTTFSKSYILGTIWPSLDDVKKGFGGTTTLGKIKNDKVVEYYTEMFDWWKQNPNNTFKDVEDLLEHSVYNSEGITTGFRQYEKYGLDEGIKTIIQKHIFVYYNTYKFLQILEEYLAGNLTLHQVLGKKFKNVYLMEMLNEMRDLQDYSEWHEEMTKVATLKKQFVMNKDDATSILF